mgnify:CR=1 FL=1
MKKEEGVEIWESSFSSAIARRVFGRTSTTSARSSSSGLETVPLNSTEVSQNRQFDMDNLTATQNNRSGTTWVLTILHWCHPLVTLGLLITTIILFLQMQYLAVEINKGENRLDELLERVQNQQQGQIQELSEKVEDNHNLTLYQMAGTFTLLTGLLTMFHMTSHLRTFTEPYS